MGGQEHRNEMLRGKYIGAKTLKDTSVEERERTQREFAEGTNPQRTMLEHKIRELLNENKDGEEADLNWLEANYWILMKCHFKLDYCEAEIANWNQCLLNNRTKDLPSSERGGPVGEFVCLR